MHDQEPDPSTPADDIRTSQAQPKSTLTEGQLAFAGVIGRALAEKWRRQQRSHRHGGGTSEHRPRSTPQEL